jgi:hypothetical protein
VESQQREPGGERVEEDRQMWGAHGQGRSEVRGGARDDLGDRAVDLALQRTEAGAEFGVPRRVQGELQREQQGLLLVGRHEARPGRDGLGVGARLEVDLFDVVEDLVERLALDDRQDEVVLVGEVRVHRALGEAGGLGDVIEGRGEEAPLGEDRPGRVE